MPFWFKDVVVEEPGPKSANLSAASDLNAKYKY